MFSFAGTVSFIVFEPVVSSKEPVKLTFYKVKMIWSSNRIGVFYKVKMIWSSNRIVGVFYKVKKRVVKNGITDPIIRLSPKQ